MQSKSSAIVERRSARRLEIGCNLALVLFELAELKLVFRKSSATVEQEFNMRLGEILVKRELVTPDAISEALERQKTNGQGLGANLIALGYLTEEQLSSVLHGAPAAPNGVSATGIPPRSLLCLLLKFMSVEGCETVLDLANRIKLPRLVVQQIVRRGLS